MLVSVLFWILWPRPVQPVVEHKSEVPPRVNPSSAPVAQSAQPANPSSPQILQQGNPEKLKQAQERSAKHIEALNKDIDFYGQTVDQDSHPLPGVQITMVVPHFLPGIDGMSIHVNRTSDANGLFDIHDATVTGDAVDIEGMSKEGYTLEPCHRGLGPTGGAPGNPMIFRLWRDDIKEPLITGQRSFDVRADGSPCILSVASNGFVQSDAPRGDFSLRLNIPQPQDGAHPNWSFEFEAANGGIAEELDPSAAMYRAPEGGYTNLFRFVLDDAHPWTRSGSKFNFYFYLADRKVYGRISFDLMFFRNKPPYIRTEYAINPTGSRILR